MAKRSLATFATVGLATLSVLFGLTTVSAAGTTQGVTSTTIRVGVPYVDVAAVKAVGVDISWGDVTDDYKALIAHINAQGGIDGRKIVPYIIPVDPTGTAPAATTCTQLTQDDKVFVVIAPLQPTCYVKAGVPVVNGVLESSTQAGVAQDFALTPPTSAFDPLELAIFSEQGVFKGKKVGVFAGVTATQSQMTSVQADLKKLHVDVVASAVDSAAEGDLTAENQQVSVIAQRFQSAGVNEVVAVGYGSALWPEGLSAIQSSYDPSWVATNESDLSGDVGGTDDPKYLADSVTASPLPSLQSIWDNAGTQRCVGIVRKAYPSAQINAYSPSLPESKASWLGVEQACTDLALFEAIAKGAGKHLTLASFMHAGYALRDVTIPGAGSVSFAASRPYALGPVYLVHYDSTSKTLVWDSKPVSK